MVAVRTALAASLAVAFVGVAAPPAVAGTVYNAVGNFRITANPNGPWSYLANGALLSQKTRSAAGIRGVIGWSNGQAEPQDASVLRNTTKATVSWLTVDVPVNYLNLDPQGNPGVTVRFTAPTAGAYTVSGSFRGDDTNERSHPVTVTRNGADLFSGSITTFNQILKFNKKVSLAAGDTIDLTSATGAGFSYLSTGLKARIVGP